MASKLTLPPFQIRVHKVGRVVCRKYFLNPRERRIDRILVDLVPDLSCRQSQQENRSHCVGKVLGDISRYVKTTSWFHPACIRFRWGNPGETRDYTPAS